MKQVPSRASHTRANAGTWNGNADTIERSKYLPAGPKMHLLQRPQNSSTSPRVTTEIQTPDSSGLSLDPELLLVPSPRPLSCGDLSSV